MCESGFTNLHDTLSCYLATQGSYTWDEARKECARLGGYLAEVASHGELLGVVDLFNNSSICKYPLFQNVYTKFVHPN